MSWESYFEISAKFNFQEETLKRYKDDIIRLQNELNEALIERDKVLLEKDREDFRFSKMESSNQELKMTIENYLQDITDKSKSISNLTLKISEQTEAFSKLET